MSKIVSDLIETCLPILVACAFTVTTLLYGLLWLSDWFDAYVPLWMLWAVTASPPAAAAGVLAYVLCRRFHRIGHLTMTGGVR